ncbi:cell wall-active antibiotics response protein LiaF [Carnobacterium gallinarum]|uniref:cell wall-active antibiotics response protein LiaF n=1 Tax=Carnobacterium gallinarum TaxID=2749 RepID=UPI0005589583|nr:cell wall-active antibiotics response protein LiaF [Carnobacterium gallinarum]
MNKSWKLFILLEGLLFIGLLYQIFKTPQLIVAFFIGALLVIWNLKRKLQKKHNNNFWLVLGALLMIFGLLSANLFWAMIVIAVIFFVLNGSTLFSNMNAADFSNAPWKRKEIMIIETEASSEKNNKRLKRSWIGSERIGNSVFEWDDINFSIFAGDTIVDLGNTLLPKDESFVVIRKGFGKTRILVPLDVGIMIEHSTLRGKVSFEGESFGLQNESVKLYSSHYEQSSRKIKIITNILFGDLEVIGI